MTYEEALTKIEKYEKKLKVMAVKNRFEFGIREDADGEARIFVRGLSVDEEDIILYVPSFVSYIDYSALSEAYGDWLEKGSEQDILNYDGKYAICFPAGCAIYQDSKDPYRAREYLSRRTGIMVQEGHPFYTSEDGVLLNKEKTALCLYPSAKETKHYTVPESVIRVEEMAFQLYNEITPLERWFMGAFAQVLVCKNKIAGKAKRLCRETGGGFGYLYK